MTAVRHDLVVILRRVGLWPRLAAVVTIGFLFLFAIFGFLAIRAVNASTSRILDERLVIAQMAARELDRLVERGFYELEKATEFGAFGPRAPSLTDESHLISHAYGRVSTLSVGVYFLDASGHLVISEPAGRYPAGADLGSEDHILTTRQDHKRSVSSPFVDQVTGLPVVALTIPIMNEDGTLRSMLGGLIDLTSSDLTGPLRHARDLGRTGHAELVDHRGLVVASTEEGGFLVPGEHLDFYHRMFQVASPGVETVPYTPWHEYARPDRQEEHVMAFARLSGVEWGVAVGGAKWDTFAPVDRLRATLLLGGGASLVVLWGLTLLGARALVRPVRLLTNSAGAMADGHLDAPVTVDAPGEIHTLAESLETMRVKLKDSLAEQSRRLEAQAEVARARDEFVSAVSHELRTPLGIIKGFATTLLRSDISVDPQTQTEFVRAIDDEAGRLQSMIDELLDASRLQAGRMPIERAPTNIGNVVEGAVARARPTIQRAGHTLTVRDSGRPIVATIDRIRIEQVLYNLLENAARYSDPGPPVEVTIEEDKGRVVISVRDHGDGITDPEHERIFEPFFRGTSAKRRGVPGTGLGLAICRGIVDAHGGRIWAESAPGDGSRFSIALPLTSPADGGGATQVPP